MGVPDFSYSGCRQAPGLSLIEAAWPLERALPVAVKEKGGCQERRKITYHNNKFVVYSFLGLERKKIAFGDNLLAIFSAPYTFLSAKKSKTGLLLARKRKNDGLGMRYPLWGKRRSPYSLMNSGGGS